MNYFSSIHKIIKISLEMVKLEKKIPETYNWQTRSIIWCRELKFVAAITNVIHVKSTLGRWIFISKTSCINIKGKYTLGHWWLDPHDPFDPMPETFHYMNYKAEISRLFLWKYMTIENWWSGKIHMLIFMMSGNR